MDAKSEFRWFRDDLCDRCGLCLVKCPVLNLPEQAARQDIEALIAGDVGKSRAFQLCTTCNLCDSVCPREAFPYELVLERFNEYGVKNGLPFLAKLVLPNEPENIWSGLRLLMDEDELGLLRRWEENLHGRHKQVLLAGFYTNIVPYLAKAKILDGLSPVIVGSEGLWGCGGDSNKLGAISLTERAVELLQMQFARMGVEKVYCFMEAEAAMLAEVLPRRFGARFDFEVVPLDYWILEKLEKGEVGIVNRLKLRATVHDNCMSRYFGGKPQEVVRRIVELTGCDLVEMEHCRSNALCCGWAATIPTLYGEGSGNPLRTMGYLLHSLYRRLEEAEATRADIVVTSCPACYIFLTLIKELSNARIRVCHPLEIVQMAAGEAPVSRAGRRCWDILAVATNVILKWASSAENRKRFSPKALDPSTVIVLPQPTESDARRIKRIARLYNGRAIQNPLSRAVIGGTVRAAIGLYRVGLKRRLRRRMA